MMYLVVDNTRAELGGEFHGRVVWDIGERKARSIEIVLRIVVTGRGEDHDETVTGLEISVDEKQGEHAFRLPVPYGVPSYVGEIFQVRWEVRAQLDLVRAIDQKAYASVRVDPAGWSRVSQTGPTPSSEPDVHPRNTLPIIDPDAPE